MESNNIVSRIKHAFNVLVNGTEKPDYTSLGMGYSYRPDRARMAYRNERSIVNSIYNRIASDAAAIDILHVKLDENDRFLESINSGLNYCLTVEAMPD